MDAPTYPPAVAFEQPVAVPYAISLENYSLAELMKIPAAWDIVSKHLPVVKMMTASTMIKPHLGNFTALSISVFGVQVKPEVAAVVNAELAKLSPAKDSMP